MQTRKIFASVVVAVGLAAAATSAFAGGRGGPDPTTPPTEVPEPATIGLLGLGVVGMIAAKRRK